MTKICLIAENEEEAYKWARSQYLSREQWFYPKQITDLYALSNFHVIVVSGHGLPSMTFEKLFKLAQERGKVGRF